MYFTLCGFAYPLRAAREDSSPINGAGKACRCLLARVVSIKFHADSHSAFYNFVTFQSSSVWLWGLTSAFEFKHRLRMPTNRCCIYGISVNVTAAHGNVSQNGLWLNFRSCQTTATCQAYMAFCGSSSIGGIRRWSPACWAYIARMQWHLLVIQLFNDQFFHATYTKSCATRRDGIWYQNEPHVKHIYFHTVRHTRQRQVMHGLYHGWFSPTKLFFNVMQVECRLHASNHCPACFWNPPACTGAGWDARCHLYTCMLGCCSHAV